MTEYIVRRADVVASFADFDIDGFLTVAPHHVAWLSGFTGSNAGLLVARDNQALATDGRYTVQAANEAPDVELVSARNTGVALLRRAAEFGIKRLGVEAELITAQTLEQLRSAAPTSVTIVPVAGVVAKQREVKSDSELAALRAVARIAVVAFEELVAAEIVTPGISERQVAAELEYRMRLHGADRPSFDTIVASGPNSAKPHHGASDRIIAAGDLVTIDFGAYAGGYNSDMTRTLFAGGAAAAPARAREIYNIVWEAQTAGVAAARAGVSLVEVDKVCRTIIEDAGFGEQFVHSTGHGIGIEVHEAPYAARTGTGTLQPGMTLTIEPGIYVPGFGGVRIEDTLIITETEPEVITPLPKPRAEAPGVD